MGGQQEDYYGQPAAALHGGGRRKSPCRHPSLYGESGGEKGQRSAGIANGKRNRPADRVWDTKRDSIFFPEKALVTACFRGNWLPGW